MSDQRRRAAAVIRSQHGLITRQQALGCGLSRHQIQRLLDAGDWLSVHRGVYRTAAARWTWSTNVLTACFTHGGIASHRTAAMLWGLGPWRQRKPEILIRTRRSVRHGDCIVHETTQWDRRDETVKDGIPVTGVARTLMDLGAVVGFRAVRTAVEEARDRRLVTDAELNSALRRHARQGRDGTVRFRGVLEACLGSAVPAKSDWSHRVTDLLVGSGLPRPELEHRVDLPTGPAFIDLAYPAIKLGIELDSHAFHSTREQLDRDARRRNRLMNAGWAMYSITWTQFTDRPTELIDLVRRGHAEMSRRRAG